MNLTINSNVASQLTDYLVFTPHHAFKTQVISKSNSMGDAVLRKWTSRQVATNVVQ